MYHSFLIHSSADGHLGCFHVLAIINKCCNEDDAVKVLHSICQQIWKSQQWPQDWKRSIFIPIPKKAMPKNVQTAVQLHSSQMLAK